LIIQEEKQKQNYKKEKRIKKVGGQGGRFLLA